MRDNLSFVFFSGVTETPGEKVKEKTEKVLYQKTADGCGDGGTIHFDHVHRVKESPVYWCQNFHQKLRHEGKVNPQNKRSIVRVKM